MKHFLGSSVVVYDCCHIPSFFLLHFPADRSPQVQVGFLVLLHTCHIPIKICVMKAVIKGPSIAFLKCWLKKKSQTEVLL